MKTNDKDKKVQAISYDIPASLHTALSESAKKNNWTIKKELIHALEEYLNGSFVRLDPSIKKAVTMYAKAKKFTVTEATNFLVTSKINVMEWAQDDMIDEANKTHEEQEKIRKEAM